MNDGARTRDRRDHNPVLYQLSYVHRERQEDTGAAATAGLLAAPAGRALLAEGADETVEDGVRHRS